MSEDELDASAAIDCVPVGSLAIRTGGILRAAALIAVSMLCAGSLAALDPERALSQLSFDVWTSDDGLPQNSVTALLQSQDGYLWVGTQDGLARFDGRAFTRIEPEKMPFPSITALAEAQDGTLWIGTEEALVRYRRTKLVDEPLSLPPGGFHVNGLLVDSRGRVWAGTDEGLVRFEGSRAVTEQLRSGGQPTIRAVAEDRSGTIWAAGDGVYRSSADGWQRLESPEGEDIWTLVPGSGGALWCAGDGGIFIAKDGRLESLPTTNALGGVRALLEDERGNLWVGTTRRGIYRCRSGACEPFDLIDHQAQRSVSAMAFDRDGSLWIATDRGGLARLRSGSFTTYGAREGLLGPAVWSVIEDRDGDLWFATDRGLARRHEGRFEFIGPERGGPSEFASTLHVDSAGVLWVGTFGSGLLKREGERFRTLRTKDGLVSNNIRAMVSGPGGELWVGTRDGISHVSQGRIDNITVDDGLPSNGAAALALSGPTLWAGTKLGLVRIDAGRVSPVVTEGNLAGATITALTIDDDGALWIGTASRGLTCLRDGRFTNFTTGDGLTSNMILEILDDGAGHLWLSGTQGVSRVSKARLQEKVRGKAVPLQPRLFARADGMRSAECNGGVQPTGLRDRNGRLWFATIDGVVVVDPSSLTVSQAPPDVRIDSITVDEREDTIVPGQSLRVPPGAKRIEIRYGGATLLDPERLRYRYLLVGFDAGWHDAGDKTEAVYTNVPPGDYTLAIQARQLDGAWSEPGTTIPIEVRPRFVQTKAFLLLVASGLVVLLTIGHKARTNALKRRQAELQTMVDERTAALNAANGELERLSQTDALTGIANRRRFDAALEAEWKRAIRSGDPVSLALADVDHFKSYNDSLGHPAGDACLREIATALAGTVRRTEDMVARYGGEEFVALLPRTPTDAASQVAETFRQRIVELGIVHPESSTGPVVSISIGIATMIPQIGSDVAKLLEAADAALYEAKRAGRNRVVAAR